MGDHRINNRQQLSHTSDQRNLWSFACGAQPFVKNADHRVPSAGNQSCHVERCPNSSSAAPYRATSSQGTAVTVEWRYTNQGSDLLTVKSSEFGQLGQKGTTNNRTDTGDTPEQVFFLLPDRALTDALVQISIGSLQFCFQPADVSIDTLSDRFRSAAQAISLGHNHLGKLAPAGNEGSQLQGNFIRQRPQCWADRFSETRQYQSVDTISLSQLARSFGKVSDLARVDHDHRELGIDQSTSELAFDSAGSFQYNQSRLDFSQAFNQGFDTGFIVGDRFTLTRRAHRNIESCLGHVDADKDRNSFQDSNLLILNFLRHGSTLRMMRAWMTQATVRALWRQNGTTLATARSLRIKATSVCPVPFMITMSIHTRQIEDTRQ
jgi:hypothetical protein